MEVYCASIERAADSWKAVQEDPNYYLTFGEALFQRIFELEPSAIALFPFGDRQTSSSNESCDGEGNASVELNPRVYPHAKAVLQMLERCLIMMMESKLHRVGEALANLGLRHVVYGVNKDHFKVLEAAVLDTLEATLGAKKWTKSMRKDWEGVLKFISKGMMVGAERGLHIKRKKIALGELSIATLRLSPTSMRNAPALKGGRFDHLNKSSPHDPPKPAPRPKFDDILDDVLPTSLPSLQDDDDDLSCPPPLTSLQRFSSEPIPMTRSSDASMRTPMTLHLVTPKRKNKQLLSPRRRTSSDLCQKGSPGSKLPKSPADPKSLLLKNEFFATIGLMGAASGRPITKKKKRASGSSLKSSRRPLKSQSERKDRTAVGLEELDISTNTWPVLGLLEQDSLASTTNEPSWPMLGLEPDATPVLPRRQVSPIPTKKKKSKSPPRNTLTEKNSISTIPVMQR